MTPSLVRPNNTVVQFGITRFQIEGALKALGETGPGDQSNGFTEFSKWFGGAEVRARWNRTLQGIRLILTVVAPEAYNINLASVAVKCSPLSTSAMPPSAEDNLKYFAEDGVQWWVAELEVPAAVSYNMTLTYRAVKPHLIAVK